MIPVRELDLIICHHCKKPFEHDDLTFSIFAGRFSKRYNGIDILSVINPEFSVTPDEIEMVIHFHKECFQLIAGVEYMP